MSSPVRVNREEFVSILGRLRAGLTKKDQTQQSASFAFRDGEVFTYNEEVACLFPDSGLPRSVECAVPADKLESMLQKFTCDEIAIDVDGGEFVVTGKGERFGVYIEAKVQCDYDAVIEPPKNWKKLPDRFVEAIDKVQGCASKNNALFALTCIHIHPEWVEASDNFQAGRYPLKMDIEKSALVRKEAVKHIIPLGMIEFALTPTWFHFRSKAGLILSVRRYPGEFEDVSSVLNFTGDKTQLPKSLPDAVEKAKVFSEEQVGSTTVLVKLSHNRLALEAEGVSGWYTTVREIEWKGRDLAFLIDPNILGDLSRHQECEITTDRLKVDFGYWTYVTALADPRDKPKRSS